MGIGEILGTEGIFICDGCRNKIQLNLDQETFNKLKEELGEKEKTMHKCFLCSQLKHSDDGLWTPPHLMADGMEKNIEKTEEMYDLYQNGTIHCPNCGIKILYSGKHIVCDCGTKINTKKFGKSLKMPSLKKITFRQYIKMLRGKSTVPGSLK